MCKDTAVSSFLGNVADFILAHHSDAGNLCVVLPNRRAGLFLKKELTERINTPAWSPTILPVEDLFFQLAGLQKADQAELLLSLYEIVKKTPGHTEEPFDGFCKWAPALLTDFNDVDSGLADPKQLFRNLADIKDIEHWSLGETTLSDFQKKYLEFWNHITNWYNELRAVMLAAGKAWSGLAQRVTAENLQERVSPGPWQHYIFAGFNALSKAEEKLFAFLSSNGKADLLWDTDRYYLEDKMNEAGKFLREYKEKFFKTKTSIDRPFEHVIDGIAGTAKNVTLIAAARNVSQARAASGFLEKEGAGFVPGETAIVLADEQLLMPVLNAVPSRFPDVNITMGYPMRNTPVFTLLHILFSLHENAARFGIKTREGDVKFYHQDIIRLLRHPYIVAGAKKPALLITFIQEMARKNMTFVSLKQLVKPSTETRRLGIEHFFNPWTSAQQAIDEIRAVIDNLRTIFAAKAEVYALDMEYLFQLNLALNRISTLFSERKGFDEISSVKTLLLQVFGSSAVPFSGEPLRGLQIMGMLETRLLDFKNVILVSANEGVLPSSSMQHSFILHDLRKAFGLPMYNDREAIAGYNYYRMIQRAENICIIYNTDQDSFGVKEKSRYVAQMLHELPKVNKQVTFRSIVAGAELDSSPVTDEITIPSSPEIISLIAKKATDGFSPSLVNTFRECRLRFYFRYVAGLREEEEVEETVDQNTLGTIMHTALEKLFMPLLLKELEPADFTAMKTKVTAACRDAFREHFPDEESGSGKNLLAEKIAQRYITNFIDQEISRITLEKTKGFTTTVLALEKEIGTTQTISGMNVLFKGKADRIDRVGPVIRLADYKTGKVEDNDVKIAAWSEFTETDKKGKAFQLMMYAWLYLKSEDGAAMVQPGIVSFRMVKKGFLHLHTPQGDRITSENLGEFEKSLFTITEQMLSEKTLFDQTPNVQQCRVCEFNAICRRV